MPRSSSNNRDSVDEETARLYNFEEESALPKRLEYNSDTSSSLPLSGQASTANPNNVEVKRRNMMYTFVPNWPLAGPRIDTLGVLGSSKSDTIKIVQRAFPSLQTYSPDRLEFLTAMHIDSNNNAFGDRLATIMDEAWPALLDCPPSRLWIRIPKTAEEAAVSEPRSTFGQNMIALSGLIVIGTLIYYVCLKAKTFK